MALLTHSPLSVPARRALGLAVLLSVAAGCDTPTARSTNASPTAAQPTSAAGQVSSPASPEASATPLPSASVDTDLEPQDQAAIDSLLNSDTLQAYLPSDLINDGGVILYQTMALRDEREPRLEPREAGPGPGPGDMGPGGRLAPPGEWKRFDGQRGGRQAKVRRVPPAQPAPSPTIQSSRVQVTVSYPMVGQLMVRPTGGRALQKPFMQTFTRSFRFALANSQWKLDELSPIVVTGRGGGGATREALSDLSIKSFEIFADGATTPALTLTDQDRFIKPDEVPSLTAAKPIRLEVALSKTPANGAYLYAHLAGKSDRSRQLLVDDGTNGDRVADDGVYTGTFAVPATSGLMHLAVDAIDAVSFTEGGVYRSQSVGVSFRAKQ